MDEIISKVNAISCKIYPIPPSLEHIFVARVGVDRASLRED